MGFQLIFCKLSIFFFLHEILISNIQKDLIIASDGSDDIEFW